MRARLERWLAKRLPETREIKLDHTNLFIMPSKTGVAFLAFLVLLWLVATNYENNLIFAVTFLLTALFITGIHHTHACLSGVTVAINKSHPAFCGETCGVEITVSHNGKRRRESIQLYFVGGEVTQLSLAEQQTQGVADVRTEAVKRGWYDPGRLIIESFYPLGLFRVWSRIKLDTRVLVYPKPVFDSGPHSQTQSSGDGQHNTMTGSEDFIGLDRYQSGQSLRHVAWKHYAREQGFLTKYYADYQDHRVWLDWGAFPGLDREARLSRLCGVLLEICRQEANQQVSYGLRLPGIEIPPGHGVAHKLTVLRELALFEQPAQTAQAEPGSVRRAA